MFYRKCYDCLLRSVFVWIHGIHGKEVPTGPVRFQRRSARNGVALAAPFCRLRNSMVRVVFYFRSIFNSQSNAISAIGVSGRLNNEMPWHPLEASPSSLCQPGAGVVFPFHSAFFCCVLGAVPLLLLSSPKLPFSFAINCIFMALPIVASLLNGLFVCSKILTLGRSGEEENIFTLRWQREGNAEMEIRSHLFISKWRKTECTNECDRLFKVSPRRGVRTRGEREWSSDKSVDGNGGNSPCLPCRLLCLYDH